MRILIVSDAWEPQVNGVVRTYQYIRDELIKAGHVVDIIGPDRFRSFPMPGYREIDLAYWPLHKLEGMIAGFEPDTIHIAAEGPLGWKTRTLCHRRGWKYSTCYHTHFPDYVRARVAKVFKPLANFAKRLSIASLRRFHKKSSALLVATQSLENTLKEWNFAPPMKRLLRGVLTDTFHPGEKTLFQDMPKPISLYVGRVAIEKNLPAFLEMNIPGTKIVVGDGPSMEELKRRFPEVQFVGKKVGEDLADHYRSADIFVFPSKTDTFGMVLIEALACGLPVAAYDVPGPKDIVTAPFLGAVDADLMKAYDNAQLEGTPEQRFEHVQRYYTWDKVAQDFARYVDSV